MKTSYVLSAVLRVFLAGALISSSFAQEAIDVVEVKAEGIGMTAAEAEKQAIVSAVQQAVGMFMDSETLVKNEQVVHDRVLSVSNGFVSRYDVTVPVRKRPSDGLFTTSILAVVKKGEVGTALRKAHLVSEAVDGANVWAEAATKAKSGGDAMALLEEHLPKMAGRLMKVRLVDGNGKSEPGAVRPEVKPGSSDDAALCTWNIAVTYDREAYYKEALPMLLAAFEVLASEKSPEVVMLNMPTRLAPELDDVNGGRRLAMLGTPVRFINWTKAFEKVPEPSAEYLPLTLNIGSDRSGQNQRFRSFRFERKTFQPLFDRSFTPLNLKVQFLNAAGEIMHEGITPVDTLLLAAPGPKDRAPAATLLDADKARLIPSQLGHHQHFEKWIISPEFFNYTHFLVPASYGYCFGASEAILLRYQASLDLQDIKEFRKVQFSFEPVKP